MLVLKALSYFRYSASEVTVSAAIEFRRRRQDGPVAFEPFPVGRQKVALVPEHLNRFGRTAAYEGGREPDRTGCFRIKLRQSVGRFQPVLSDGDHRATQHHPLEPRASLDRVPQQNVPAHRVR